MYLDDSILYAVGREIVVDVLINSHRTGELYIDDLIGATVDVPGSNHADRLSRAFLLAIFTAARERHPDEPVPREEMAARSKLLAEAGPSEEKIILG